MKLVPVAPLYFIFKPLSFGGTHISLLLLIYVILKGRYFFHTLCVGHRLYAHCSPTPGRAQRMESSPTFDTLLPCHTSPTRAPSLRITL